MTVAEARREQLKLEAKQQRAQGLLDLQRAADGPTHGAHVAHEPPYQRTFAANAAGVSENEAKRSDAAGGHCGALALGFKT